MYRRTIFNAFGSPWSKCLDLAELEEEVPWPGVSFVIAYKSFPATLQDHPAQLGDSEVGSLPGPSEEQQRREEGV